MSHRGHERRQHLTWTMYCLAVVVSVLASGLGEAQERRVLHEYFSPEGLAADVAATSARSDDVVSHRGQEIPEPSPDLAGNGEELTLSEEGAQAPERAPKPKAHNGKVPGINDLQLDDDTDKEESLEYFTAFNPSVLPFKRGGALDQVKVDRKAYRLTVNKTRRRTLEIPRAVPAPQPNHDRFWGSARLLARPGVWIPIPSVAANAMILSYEVVPKVPVVFAMDSADNFFVKVEHDGVVRLNFLTEAPQSYFGTNLPSSASLDDVPKHLRPPRLPRRAKRAAKRVIKHMKLDQSRDMVAQINTMVRFYRSFEAVPLDSHSGDNYLDISMNERGVCRHRAFSFVITAHALGIPARYVYNEAHAFVEVYIPRVGWTRIDLGGAAEGLDVFNADQKLRHQPDQADPFPKPDGYVSPTDAVADTGGAMTPGASGFDKIRNAPPAAPTPSDDKQPTSSDPAKRADAEQPDREGSASAESDGGPSTPSEAESEVGSTLESMALSEEAKQLFRDPNMSAIDPPPAVAPTPNPAARPSRAPAKQATQMTLNVSVSGVVFRGDGFPIMGRIVAESDGAPVVNGTVKVMLKAQDDDRWVALSEGTTDVNGRFSVLVTLPQTLSLGQWELVVVFEGDDAYEPTRGE